MEERGWNGGGGGGCAGGVVEGGGAGGGDDGCSADGEVAAVKRLRHSGYSIGAFLLLRVFKCQGVPRWVMRVVTLAVFLLLLAPVLFSTSLVS
eukprot:3986453-Pleurochrysis_carterae.AAC.1